MLRNLKTIFLMKYRINILMLSLSSKQMTHSKKTATKYYLTHGVANPEPEKILKILQDGYLYANRHTGQYGLFYGETLDHVYLSLLGDENVSFAPNGVNFIFDTSILYKKKFRYAFNWIGNDIEKSIKVNPKYDNVDQILDIINQHIVNIDPSSTARKLTSHEILIKDKINLHEYLVAMCCISNLTTEIINYIRTNYPKVILIENPPNSAIELTYLLKNNKIKHKYKKYKSKYLNLKKEINKNQFIVKNFLPSNKL
ncbi:hypothetical protein QJ856_gp0390 [Tupanvirus deep ocean]|uniref:Uncharacterized protein n=2 Tax=Tupanvirus TaxID=2094720 RepID=A0AC62A9M7_9VIRU|nr:hypothetical protein QJ856_gp0390 [Tupanvirus deep ocean]QKU34348.1 hypothetical protein [Tupanvirus deep ocean]